MRYSGFLGPTWCSVLQEIGSRIFAGSLNIHCLEGILEEARGKCLPSQLLSGESKKKKKLVRNPRVLKTPVCSVGEGQRCGPPDSVIKTADPASAGRRAWTLPTCLSVLFCFSFFSFCSGGQKLLSDSVRQEKVSNFLGRVVCRVWGLLLPLSKELYCWVWEDTYVCFSVLVAF